MFDNQLLTARSEIAVLVITAYNAEELFESGGLTGANSAHPGLNRVN